MTDGSPLDESIFSIDSDEYEPSYEFDNPRQLTITSDGSEEQQGEYSLTLGFYYADNRPPTGKQLREVNYLVTILAWDPIDNKPPNIETPFNDTYIVRVNERKTVCWTSVDEDPEKIITKPAKCPGLSAMDAERL